MTVLLQPSGERSVSERTRNNRAGKAFVLLFALFALLVCTAPASESPYYCKAKSWKPNDVLRYEYSKSISTIEETNLDEVYSDGPVTLVKTPTQNGAQIVVFTSRTFLTAEKTWRLAAPKTMAVCAPGDKLTLTGLMEEDERHFRWIEVRDSKGVTGFLPGNTKVDEKREFGFDAILIIEITKWRDVGAPISIAPAPTGAVAAGTTATSTIATITTSVPHTFLSGQVVKVSGVGTGGERYNGTITIESVPSPTTFTYTVMAGLPPSGGGTVILQCPFAVLHFEPPHVVMPDEYLFMPTSDEPVPQKEKSKLVLRALEGAIKLARWYVVFDINGVVHIDSRVPKGLDDWLQETEHIAFWRGKYRKQWIEIVEKYLGMVATADDRNLFLALNAPPESTGTAVSNEPALDKIRPYRSAAELISLKCGKAEYRFERKSPPQAGKPYAIPFIGPRTAQDGPSVGPASDPKVPNVFMVLKPGVRGPVTEANPKGEDQQVGTAVLDIESGMLDSLSEGYSFETECYSDEDARRHYKIGQRVSVTYSLKRLFPPVSQLPEQSLEAPLAPRK